MAEPTLKDVLKAISELDSKVDRRVGELDTKVDALDTKVDAVDTKVDALDTKVDAVDTKVDALDTKVDALRTEMKKGFADLDKELTGHAAQHREIEKDIEALKRRPARTAVRAPRRPRTR